jgi:hypothetical protein
MRKVISSAALLAALSASSAFADQSTTAVQADSRPYVLSTQGKTRAFPSVFGAGSAFVAPGGAVYGALTYTNPRGGVAGAGGDADVSLGFGLGSPTENVGVNVGLDIRGSQPFGDAGAFSLTFARALSTTDKSATFVSVGASQLGAFGTSRGSAVKYNATISHLTSLGSADNEFPVMVTAGFANRNTYSRTNIGTLSDGFFVGAGIGVAKNLAVSLSATQTQLNIGTSFTVPGLDGVSVSLGMYDVANTVQRRQTALTVSYSMSNLFGK